MTKPPGSGKVERIAVNLLASLKHHQDLLWILVMRNIKIRYKNSSLGFLWTLLSPILLIVIYKVFLSILRFKIDLPVLVIGIMGWNFLSMCMGDSLYAVLGNANMVKKSAFPRIVLPLSMVLANLVNFLLFLVVVCFYLLILHVVSGLALPGLTLIALPLIIVTQLALCLGVSLISSSLNVYFRDMEHIQGIVMMAWFFMTPVIYPVSQVTSKFESSFQILFFLNPMTGLVSAYRAILLNLPFPSVGLLALSAFSAWIILLAGLRLFDKLQVRFADVL
jgi:lipopolysaccharide transport system permease protein